MDANLHDIPGWFETAMEKALENEDGQREEAAAHDLVYDLSTGLAQTAPNVGLYILQLRGEQELIEKEEKRLRRRRQVLANKEKWLSAQLHEAMRAEDVKRLTDPKVSITRKANPLKCIVDNAATISDEWVETRVERVVRKADLIEHYKATGEVPDGVRFEQGESLLIR